MHYASPALLSTRLSSCPPARRPTTGISIYKKCKHCFPRNTTDRSTDLWSSRYAIVNFTLFNFAQRPIDRATETHSQSHTPLRRRTVPSSSTEHIGFEQNRKALATRKVKRQSQNRCDWQLETWSCTNSTHGAGNCQYPISHESATRIHFMHVRLASRNSGARRSTTRPRPIASVTYLCICNTSADFHHAYKFRIYEGHQTDPRCILPRHAVRVVVIVQINKCEGGKVALTAYRRVYEMTRYDEI